MCNKSIFRVLLLSLLFVGTSTLVMQAQCSISDLIITNSDCDENDNFSIELNFEYSDPGANGFQVLGNGNNYGTFQYEDLPIVIEGLMGNCDVELEFIVRDVIDPTCAAFLNYGTVCCDEECTISVINFETSECNDNLAYTISLNLEYQFVGDDGFSVAINGQDYGNFNYSELPLVLEDVISEEDGLNEVTICDLGDEECCASYSYLNPCFCGMSNVTSEIIDCDITDSSFYSIINFDHVATNDSFQMGYSNGGSNIFLGTFAYADLPVTVGPVLLSESDQEILIVDTEDFFCFSTAYLGIVDDCTIECQLFNVFAEAIMCEEGEYFMEVEFEGKDLEGSSFEILIDGISYGIYEYGESTYSVGPIPSNCDVAPTVVIQDLESELCSDFYNFSEPICCPPDCNFTSMEVSVECGVETMTLNGTFENDGSMLSAFYFVQFLGTSYGPFLYGDFTFSIEVPVLANGTYEITINDSNDPDCFLTTTFMVQCEEEPCIIFDVFAEASECEEESFFVDIEFQFAGETSDSFTIQGNGTNYGTFSYGATFYTVGPLVGDCETLYEFVISDQVHEGCNSFFAFDEPICCLNPCEISEVEILEFECVDALNVSNFVLNFSYENVPSEMFEVRIDGLSLGSFFYADLPVNIEISTGLIFELLIQDSEDFTCIVIQEFELECPVEDCSISEVSTDFIECTEDKNAFFIRLNFEFQNTSSSFSLVSDGSTLGTFDYASLPVTVGPLDIDTEYNIDIIDTEFEGCGNEFQYYLEQCETSTQDIDLDKVEIIQLNDQLILTNNANKDVQLRLFTLTGQMIQKANILKNGIIEVNTANWSSGLYFLTLVGKNNQQTIKLLIH